MKKLLLLVLLAPLTASAQKPEPFKGAKKIVGQYAISGDSLYTFLSKEILKAGYELDKRDKDLRLVSTGPKHIKFIDYKMQVVVEGSTAVITGLANSNMSMSSGGFEVRPSWVDAEYRSKADLRRNVFDDMIKFVQSTRPESILFDK